jgi:hypothetical protein
MVFRFLGADIEKILQEGLFIKDIVDVVGDRRESMHGHPFTPNFTLTIHRKASRIPGEKIFFARLEAVSL